MTPSPAFTDRRRQALIDQAGGAGGPGLLHLFDSVGGAIVVVALAQPCGVVDASGVSLTTTDFAQVFSTADVASARLEDFSGGWVGNFTVGLSTDIPAPELVLPALRLYAGSFVRLVGAHIACD